MSPERQHRSYEKKVESANGMLAFQREGEGSRLTVTLHEPEVVQAAEGELTADSIAELTNSMRSESEKKMRAILKSMEAQLIPQLETDGERLNFSPVSFGEPKLFYRRSPNKPVGSTLSVWPLSVQWEFTNHRRPELADDFQCSRWLEELRDQRAAELIKIYKKARQYFCELFLLQAH